MEEETQFENALQLIRKTEILATGYYLITDLKSDNGFNIARTNNGTVFE